jgi:hypothetical protein
LVYKGYVGERVIGLCPNQGKEKPLKRILFALVAVGFLAAATSTASAATDTIYAPRDCTKPKIEPKSITLTCGDAQTVLKHLHWEDWNGPKVKGEGDLWVNNCDPTCYDGSIDRFEVKVRLLNPKPYMCGGQTLTMYRRAHIRFADDAPPHQNSYRSFQLFCE